MPGIRERIAELEKEISRTQKNKATNSHLCLARGRLARLRAELVEEQSSSAGGGGEGFDVQKSGAARIAMVGFPSVGKSTLLNTVTDTESLAAGYEFTTLTAIPGVLRHKGCKLQLLDLPGIIEGASQGLGRGRQVISAARTADCILFMLDATKGDVQRDLLMKELYAVGIRINEEPPDITFKKKGAGGIKFNSTVTLTHVTERDCKVVLQEFKIHHADILFRGDYTLEQFLDVVVGGRSYIPAVYAYNKIDELSVEELDYFAEQPNSVLVSCHQKLNIDRLIGMIWRALNLVRVYTRRRGAPPDFSEAIVLRNNPTIRDVCDGIHRDMHSNFKQALVWGTSAKHQPQRVGLGHVVEDEDVVQIVTKTAGSATGPGASASAT